MNQDLFLMDNLVETKKSLSSIQNVFITTHPRPDADALGSSLALAMYLEKKGKSVTVVTPTAYPDFISWMKSEERVIVFEGNEDLVKNKLGEADAVFCLDFNALKRIDRLGVLVDQSDTIKFMIDHHMAPDNFCDHRLWTDKASATAELIYDFIVQLGDQELIDVAIAECIYAGIMTDTGSFRFPSTSAKVHRLIANLIDVGVENSDIHRKVYDNNSEIRMRFLGYSLSERMTVHSNQATAYIVISDEDKKRFDVQLGDTEGLVNYALSIKGVKFAILIKEDKDLVKMSFRSVGDFDVNEFARKYFNGGGHKNAAGGRSDYDLRGTVDKIEALLPVYSKQIKGE